jgi:hypothetical protein
MVLGAAVTLLTNPLFLKMAMLLLSCASAFVLAVVLIRSLRRNLDEEPSFSEAAAGAQMIAGLRRQLEQRGELSAAVAAKLRESLVPMFAGGHLASDRNSKQKIKLSADIAETAKHPVQPIGGFGDDHQNAKTTNSDS